jgi:hypothetical protein
VEGEGGHKSGPGLVPKSLMEGVVPTTQQASSGPVDRAEASQAR